MKAIWRSLLRLVFREKPVQPTPAPREEAKKERLLRNGPILELDIQRSGWRIRSTRGWLCSVKLIPVPCRKLCVAGETVSHLQEEWRDYRVNTEILRSNNWHIEGFDFAFRRVENGFGGVRSIPISFQCKDYAGNRYVSTWRLRFPLNAEEGYALVPVGTEVELYGNNERVSG